MIYVGDYNNLSQYIPKALGKAKDPFDCINYEPFIGKNICVHTVSGVSFPGVLVRNQSRCIVLTIKRSNRKNCFSVKVVIRKSSVVAVAYTYI